MEVNSAKAGCIGDKIGTAQLQTRQQFSLLGVELLARQYASVTELTELGKLLVRVRLMRSSGRLLHWTVWRRAGKTLSERVRDLLPVVLMHVLNLSLVAGGEDCQGPIHHA